MTTISEEIDTTTVLNKTIEVLTRTDKDGKKIGTIIDVARELGMTIADVSKDIALFAEESEKLYEVFVKRRWPRNVVSGFIFNGNTTHEMADSHRKNFLIPGQHVFARILPVPDKLRKGKHYVVFLSVPRKKRKFFLHRIDSREDGKIKYFAEPESSVWFIENDRPYHEYKDRQLKNNKILLPSDETKIENVKDKEIDIIEERSLVSVFHKWGNNVREST